MGLLNCHPDVLCLYEADLPAPIPNSYAVRLLRSFPHWRDCFGGPVEPVNHYSRLAGRLAEDGHQYLCLLDKIPTLAPPWLTHAQTPPVIYAVRDVRTWLGKGSIDQMYVCEHNLVPAAVDYAMAFISSFRLGPERCLHVGVEEFLQVDSPVPRRVFEFLDVPYLAELDHWWELIAARQQEDSIKSTFNWLKFHPSSTRRPGASDTSVELSDHDFWGRYLPIFDEFRGAAISTCPGRMWMRRWVSSANCAEPSASPDAMPFARSPRPASDRHPNVPGVAMFRPCSGCVPRRALRVGAA